MDDHDKWEVNVQLEQIKLLFDYTKFHIGLYTTFTAAYIALMTSDYGKKFLVPNRWFVWTAVVLIAVAGVAGGIIASSCPHYSRLDSLMKDKIAPYVTGAGLTGRMWTHVEHTTFWFGLGFAILSFVVRGDTSVADPSILGSAIVFEQNVSNGYDRKYPYQQLVQLESYRPVLICLEPNAELELMVATPHGTRMQQLHASTGPACTVVYGQDVSARAKSNKPQRVKVGLTLDGVK